MNEPWPVRSAEVDLPDARSVLPWFEVRRAFRPKRQRLSPRRCAAITACRRVLVSALIKREVEAAAPRQATQARSVTPVLLAQPDSPISLNIGRSGKDVSMKNVFLITLIILSSAMTCMAQASGNVAYSQTGGNRQAEQNERNKRLQNEAPPTATTMFVDASVLMNVKADEHIAVFAVNQECATVPECNQQMDAAIAAFTAE